MPDRSVTCSVDGCDHHAYARTVCKAHYQRHIYSGTLDRLPPPRSRADLRTDEERFWARVDKTGECWLWTGYLNDGYGIFWAGPRPRTPRGPHRVSYEWVKGAIPEGLQIDHLCRVRHCVNPEHLEVVTQRENILRGRGAAVGNLEKTHCPRGHAYAGENLLIQGRKRNQRACRTCGRARNKAWREARKSA